MLLLGLSLTACRTAPEVRAAAASHAEAASLSVYVVRRGWHVDVGMAVQDLGTPLQPLATQISGSRYVFFGFGDRRYLLQRGTGNLLLALWPGRGVILLTSLTVLSPAEAFGPGDVVTLKVTPQQMEKLQTFMVRSLDAERAPPRRLAAGPYADSGYYDTSRTYSAFHTCNTWVAEALQAAQLPVHSAGVEFAGQLWVQVLRLKTEAASAR
jgi:hypothetical protein